MSNTILAVFQLTNEMCAKAAHKFMANVDYIFTSLVQTQTEELCLTLLYKKLLKNVGEIDPLFLCQFLQKVGREIRERVEEGEKEESSENGLRERRERVRWN